MSYYYTYYVGFMTADERVYPLGPYDAFGKLHDVYSISSSFASDIHEDFWKITENQVTDELRKEFEYTDWENKKVVQLRYKNVDDLPKGSYIRTGYFLAEDVAEYRKDNSSEGLFYDRIDPEVYSAMLMAEAVLGEPKPKKDCTGEEYYSHGARDYMYFAYPDYNSEEYEGSLLREEAFRLGKYNQEIPKDAKLVILLSEG